jgi:hypothetical protein
MRAIFVVVAIVVSASGAVVHADGDDGPIVAARAGADRPLSLGQKVLVRYGENPEWLSGRVIATYRTPAGPAYRVAFKNGNFGTEWEFSADRVRIAGPLTKAPDGYALGQMVRARSTASDPG